MCAHERHRQILKALHDSGSKKNGEEAGHCQLGVHDCRSGPVQQWNEGIRPNPTAIFGARGQTLYQKIIPAKKP